MALTSRQQLFVKEFLKDLNVRQAALRAGYSDAHHRVMDSPEVADAIAQAHAERNARLDIDADMVLREVLAIATADTNEIVEIRRGCCRYCYGTEHRYQYTDQRELGRARAAFDLTEESLVEAFEHGGLGFDAKKTPHAECSQCGGEGGAYVHVKDTRLLSPQARALFAGAKQTKDGIEVKLHSKDKHVELLMRHLGLLNDKLEVTGNLGDRIVAARKRQRGGS